MARAPRARAKSTAASASARLTPRRRNPARVNRHVSAQTLRSDLSSDHTVRGCCAPDRRTPDAARRRTSPQARHRGSRRGHWSCRTQGGHSRSVRVAGGRALDRERRERLSRLELVPLALTPRALTSRPENRLEILTGGLVRRHDANRRVRARHEMSLQPCSSPGNPARVARIKVAACWRSACCRASPPASSRRRPGWFSLRWWA